MIGGLHPQIVGRRETILIVDGSALSRNITEQVLRHHGYRPLVAGNGAEALLVCGMVDARVDLLIVDAVNTGIPGARVVSRLRQWYPKLPCVYVASREALRDAGSLHLVPLVIKPFGVRTFLQTVRATLDDD